MPEENQPRTLSPSQKMANIVALAKRRGFVFPASEIYGGLNGFYDFGPLGAQLKNNIRDAWWRDMVECPPLGPDGKPLTIVGLDSAIIQNPETWVASGHATGFADPMQTCRQCKKLFRADHVWEMLKESDWVKSFADAMSPAQPEDLIVFDSGKAMKWAKTKGRKCAPGLALVRNPEVTLSWMVEDLIREPGKVLGIDDVLRHVATEQKARTGLQTPCPNCGGDLTEPRQFNLMFESRVGAVEDGSGRVWLRPETAQGIFLNYKNILDTGRVKIPFGVAQVGKAFRNEVTPRNFIFRTREFEQMEMEFFCPPDDAPQWYEFWVTTRLKWWRERLGLSPERLQRREHDKDELSHYSTSCADVEYKYPFTEPKFGELEGIAHRGNFDLTQHQARSRTNLEYVDQDGGNTRYLPHVIEPASGLTRGALAVLCDSYEYDPARPSPEWLRIKPELAPIKLGVFPLVNKDGMPEMAGKIYLELRQKFISAYDAKASIGKRYARMDEAGTPFCVTVDGDSLKDGTVTVRDRDTARQERVDASRLKDYLGQKLG